MNKHTGCEEKNVRTVSFLCQKEGTTDLFKCKENGKVYCRQSVPGNDKKVRWLTTNKWKGGYEADMPLKAGIKVIVVDKNGCFVFDETTVEAAHPEDTFAEKRHQFFSEEIKSIVQKESKAKSLIDHNTARERVLSKMDDYGYTGDIDIWFYTMTEELSEDVVATYETLRGSVQLYATKLKHQVTGQEFIEYLLQDKKEDIVLDICGYAFAE